MHTYSYMYALVLSKKERPVQLSGGESTCLPKA